MKQFAVITMLFLLSTLGTAAVWANTDPVAPVTETQKVYVTVGVLDVDAINSADQSFTLNLIAQFRWFDPRLAHDGETAIRRQLTEIQAPRFILVNRQRTWSSLLNVVDITPEGEALYRMRLWGDFSQIMRLREFPFDSHVFQIPIVAISHNGATVELLPDPEEESFIAQQLSVADWKISDWSVETGPLNLIKGGEENGFIFSFKGARISGHILIKFIIPLFLIVAMSWVVFWIDPAEGSSQLGVAVTAVLTLIAYHIALSGKLPDISYLTRMDLFLFGSTLLVFSSLIEVVTTSRLAIAGRLQLARWIDVVCRVLFPALYAVVAYLALIAGVGATV
ncbi:MAG: hypothetical protein V7754_16645 [Halioglobus sp.]